MTPTSVTGPFSFSPTAGSSGSLDKECGGLIVISSNLSTPSYPAYGPFEGTKAKGRNNSFPMSNPVLA